MAYINDQIKEFCSTKLGKIDWEKGNFFLFFTEAICGIMKEKKINDKDLSKLTGISLNRLTRIFTAEGKDLEIEELVNILISLGYNFKYNHDLMNLSVEKDNEDKR